ncbi:MAG: hypothetical protein ACYC0O_12900 [Desulfurivibrionaceae bacterium]|jgi:hypothetical protein|nr:hypothetical protein [Pseudomonadota bacterium]MCG2824399.1 hypothetical protein [Desulfobulbaceae bacterium]MDP2003652.1 hypothetical protein [Desulfurivibrionaceae bacterium]PKN23476.1 MAG: hypothetical protein CVU68_00930 [Deltaproteobacteria bacterium HGW-Deltaproteobacteria-3]
MPTWKKKEEEGASRFAHLCEACDGRQRPALKRDGWELLREGEPAACSECALNCRLTAQGLWGADEQTRLAVCRECPDLAACALKGRYYC